MDKKKLPKNQAKAKNASSKSSDAPDSEEVPSTPPLHFLSPAFAALRRWSSIIQMCILFLCCLLAFTVRVFSVIRYESVIHEFDPWFNYRATKYLAKEGFYQFWNWYDSESWYPLGRVVGGTVFPGIMATASLIKWAGDALAFPMDIRNVCVFLAPVFAGLTSLATYLLAKEATGRAETGLLAAYFMSVCGSYVSRSVAGSYDNEGVSIFALVITFYFWVKAVNTGSMLWSIGCVLCFFYMVAAWGGYSFIINIIPIFVAGTIFVGRFSMKIYVAYSVFYVLGTLMAMLIPFVGFQAMESSEHLASHCVFFIMNVYVAVECVRSRLSERQFQLLSRLVLGSATFLFFAAYSFLTLSGATRFSGRSLTLLDPTYAKKYIPIIASVSEHKPTSWSSFFYDLQHLMIFMPVGFYFCLIGGGSKGPGEGEGVKDWTAHGKMFVALYGMLSSYFASVMVRLLLVVAPAACVLGAIGVSEILRKMASRVRKQWVEGDADVLVQEVGRKGWRRKLRVPAEVAVLVFVFLVFNLQYYVYHETWIAAEAYSSPSVVMDTRRYDGGRTIIDDYREAYYWLKQNTPSNSKVLSWWDYGYQIAGMANRTVIVDNNTWNNTHIATVGLTMASSEEDAYRTAKYLGANYVLVMFGGMANHGGDDISKFLWMVRIAAGVFGHIREQDYYGDGHYRVDSAVSQTMRESLMYKLCYYRFEEVKQNGYDEMRKCDIGYKGYKLRRFREAYASKGWMVRIFEVKPEENMDPSMHTRWEQEEQEPLKQRNKINRPRI